MRSVRIQSISSPLMDTIGYVAIALLLLVGRNEIQHHRMTVGDFITFNILLFTLYDRCGNSHRSTTASSRLWASASIFKFFDAEDDVKERPHAVVLKGFTKSIGFENVGFSYSTEEGEHQILHNVDLQVRAGEVLAVVGPAEQASRRWSTSFLASSMSPRAHCD